MIYFFSVLSFLILLTVFYRISHKINLVDKPNYRKMHNGNIPLIGGIIIYLNTFIFFFYYDSSYYFSIIFYTSVILLILGTLDDAIELGVTFRLISQLISCLIIIGSGLMIVNIGDYMLLPNIKIGILSITFTVFCVIGLTNAFNFIDGADGLCGGLFLISLISLLIFTYFSNTYYLIYDIKIIFILIISVILFLIFNLSKQYKIFLGDSGSMILGFIISWFLILYTQVYETIHPVLALWCVTIPTFDIISVIIRRILRGKNPFRPDRRHIHHILLNLGFRAKIVTFIILSSAFLINMVGIIMLNNYGPFPSLIAFLFFFILYLFLSINLSRFRLKN